MERWAKSMNQKKGGSVSTPMPSTSESTSSSSSAAADAGFNVLQGKSSAPLRFGFGTTASKLAPSKVVVVEPEEDDERTSGPSEGDFTDWAKLACLLCKRQFPSKDILTKHNLMSGLHLENLAKWKKANGK
jgi:RNA-binding protein 5/10